MIDPLLLARAREFVTDTGDVRTDATPAPLTPAERAAMIESIAKYEPPIRADMGDTYVSGMMLGAIKREIRRRTYEAAAAAQDRWMREQAAERAEAAAFAAAKAKIDYQQGLDDSNRHATERAQMADSWREVRGAIAANGRSTTAPTEEEIRDAEEARRKGQRWRS